MERRKHAQLGFTLIEIMIVVVILGILAAIIVPRIMGSPEKARITAAKTEIGHIKTALNLYYTDNSFYPTTDQGLAALVTKPTTDPVPQSWKDGGYMDKVPNDPWNHPYQYINDNGRITVCSKGPTVTGSSTDTKANADDDWKCKT